MGKAMFYHLTQRPLETVLLQLLERIGGQGWRVAIKGMASNRLEWLDQKLWLGPEEGFLAHGLAGGAHDADQPVLLTLEDSFPNGPQVLMSIDGAEVSAPQVQAMERVCILFDGHSAPAMATARDQWRALTEAGVAAEYWSEESGRWEKKRETEGA